MFNLFIDKPKKNLYRSFFDEYIPLKTKIKQTVKNVIFFAYSCVRSWKNVLERMLDILGNDLFFIFAIRDFSEKTD